jgi:nucleoside-diphosphate-sugar epimerase
MANRRTKPVGKWQIINGGLRMVGGLFVLMWRGGAFGSTFSEESFATNKQMGSDTEQRRILVTGATGFVGRCLCSHLTTAGYVVVAVGRQKQPGPWEQFVVADLEREVPHASCFDGLWGIVHLAGIAHVSIAPTAEHNPYFALSVDATQRLLEMARSCGIERFLYMSSVKTMGEGNPREIPLRPIDETWPYSLQSSYGLAKLKGEGLVLASGLPHPVVLRPPMVFGLDNPGNLPRMREAIRNKRFPPLEDNGNRRSMIHVEDLAEYAKRALEISCAANQVYIVCHEEAVSTRQLYDALLEGIGGPPVTFAIPIKLLKMAAVFGSVCSVITSKSVPFDREVFYKLTGSAWYDGSLACRELGFSARYSVLEWARLPENGILHSDVQSAD